MPIMRRASNFLVWFLVLLSCHFQEHTGRVFRLQFDEFQIVSSSHDDTILIWDFLHTDSPSSLTPGSRTSPQRTYTYVSM